MSRSGATAARLPSASDHASACPPAQPEEPAIVTFQLILGLLALCLVLALVAKQLDVPFAVVLVLGGMAIAFVPGLPQVDFEPELALALFLPPLLQLSAYRTDWSAFRSNLRPILLLALGAVLFTAAAVAVIARWLVPELPWGAAIALGAIVAPPDAVAATAVLRNLRPPKRHGSPEWITTDGLRSYGAATDELGNREKQETGRWANNRVANSHLPFRRRERAMARFRRMSSLQKFASVHANFYNHFSLERHLVDRQTYKDRRSVASAEWQVIASETPALPPPPYIVERRVRIRLTAPPASPPTSTALPRLGLRRALFCAFARLQPYCRERTDPQSCRRKRARSPRLPPGVRFGYDALDLTPGDRFTR